MFTVFNIKKFLSKKIVITIFIFIFIFFIGILINYSLDKYAVFFKRKGMLQTLTMVNRICAVDIKNYLDNRPIDAQEALLIASKFYSLGLMVDTVIESSDRKFLITLSEGADGNKKIFFNTSFFDADSIKSNIK